MFTQAGIETIPLSIYRLMGVYRYEEASVVCLVLLGSLILMGFFRDWVLRKAVRNEILVNKDVPSRITQGNL
jgi:ABC-type Fe3+ transport system permease subunit